MTMQFVVTVAIFQLAISSCYAVTGVIWHKQQQEFVQLFSIPQFAAFRKENLASHHSFETQNLKGEEVKVVYYQEKNMVMFYDNDTKIDGFYGELWSLLADYLNFTLVPIKRNFRNFGQKLENGTQTGLLGVLGRDEAHVIMRSGYTVSLMDLLQYTVPLWKVSFHIYILPEWQFDNTWILKLLSWQSWYYTVFLFIILSCVGYFLQKVSMDKSKRKRKGSTDFTIGDHVFYTFAIMTARGDPPETFYNKFRILSMSKSMFAWLILLAFGSHLIYRMTNRELMLPFNDVPSLIRNTHYTLLVFRGSFLYNYFREKYQTLIENDSSGRVRFIEVSEDMHNTVCSDMKKYAMFQSEDRFMAMNRAGCPLQPMGSFNESWMTFALQKNFRYKKAINTGLVKFREVGLLAGLKEYWFNPRLVNTDQAAFKRIDLGQVHLIFLILCCGILISLVILILEKITHYYETKNVRQHLLREIIWLLKLMKVGLLKNCWLESRIKQHYNIIPQPIETHQVFLIIAVMCCVWSNYYFHYSIIEKVVFAYKTIVIIFLYSITNFVNLLASNLINIRKLLDHNQLRNYVL